MIFHIEHVTDYSYSEPASECFSELRLRPRNSARQTLFRYVAQVEPAVPLEAHTDYFGNSVETFAIPFRHQQLVVRASCHVMTQTQPDPLIGLDLTVSEARLLCHKWMDLHAFLQPSHYIPFSSELAALANEHLKPHFPLAEALHRLNEFVFSNCKYTPGATHAQTSVLDMLKTREGVCQDYAHLMIGICRMAGIPARYVSGYIESDTPTGSDQPQPLIGAGATHAWLELFSPNGFWTGFDPTNKIREDERHVQIGIGRDYYDVPPLKGIFKGTSHQSLDVRVQVRRV